MNKSLISEAFTFYFNGIEQKGYRAKTVYEYQKDLKQFTNYLASHYPHISQINDVKAVHLNDYLDWLIAHRGCTASTRNRRKNTLRSVWKYLLHSGVVTENIALELEQVEAEKVEQTFLTEDEVNQLLPAITSLDVRRVVLVLYYTGMRISECINLRREDLNFQDRTMRIINGKGGKQRTIPLSRSLNSYLLKYVRDNDINGKMFFTRSGGMTDRYVNKCLKQATDQLCWDKKVTCHTLRHSFASTLVSKNINVVTIQKLLGHANLQTTSSYTHVTQQSVEDAVEHINAQF